MTIDDAPGHGRDGPDAYLEFVDDLVALRWNDGTRSLLRRSDPGSRTPSRTPAA